MDLVSSEKQLAALAALELVEDEGLEIIVDRRRRDHKPSIPHAEAKRRLGLR